MALWMEAGSEPETHDEIFDLAAISALKESAAIELKEKGNDYVKKGKKHYSDAIDCYSRAINQNALTDSEHSILYSNRAHVNLLMGNYRLAQRDAEEAIKCCPTNVKGFYRAAKSSMFLNMLDEAKSYCEKGLHQSPDNEELRKLSKQIDTKKSEQERHEADTMKAVADAKYLMSALEDRRLKVGKAMYQELTGMKKPILDKSNMLHWPVTLLYPEVMSSDIIEDFCETDTFSVHLDMMFSESSPPLSWDTGNAYTRDSIEVYYQADFGVSLSKKSIIRYLLQGTSASHEKIYDTGDSYDSNQASTTGVHEPKWIKVDERRTLHDTLKDPDFIIPGVPVFFVVSRRSSFYKIFTSGNWSLP